MEVKSPWSCATPERMAISHRFFDAFIAKIELGQGARSESQSRFDRAVQTIQRIPHDLNGTRVIIGADRENSPPAHP